jgi:hypothetical protein
MMARRTKQTVRTWGAALAVGAMMAVAPSAWAQTLGRRSEPGTGAVVGRVVDDATGQGVVAVAVILRLGARGVWGQTVTDDTGRFVFIGVPATEVTLEVAEARDDRRRSEPVRVLIRRSKVLIGVELAVNVDILGTRRPQRATPVPELLSVPLPRGGDHELLPDECCESPSTVGTNHAAPIAKGTP